MYGIITMKFRFLATVINVGVDVFFVISGYLISGIIIKQAKKNKFSYDDFYSRRIKRIYPALLLVLVFVLWLAFRVYEDKLL